VYQLNVHSLRATPTGQPNRTRKYCPFGVPHGQTPGPCPPDRGHGTYHSPAAYFRPSGHHRVRRLQHPHATEGSGAKRMGHQVGRGAHASTSSNQHSHRG
jgi:hypothetical protein